MSGTHIDALEADNGGREMAVEVEREGDRVSLAVLEYDGEVTRVACVHLTTDDAFIVGDTINACATEVRARMMRRALVGELDRLDAERDEALAEATRLADIIDKSATVEHHVSYAFDPSTIPPDDSMGAVMDYLDERKRP